MRYFSHQPFIFDLSSELGRRFQFGQEVTDELVARTIFAETIQDELLGTVSLSSHDKGLFLRRVANFVPLLVIRQCFDNYFAGQPGAFRPAIDLLKEKSISDFLEIDPASDGPIIFKDTDPESGQNV